MTIGICEVVVTGPDPDALAALTRVLVEERLCACGQVIGGVRSIYRWKAEIYDHDEARVALHTRVDLIEAVVGRVGDLHPYDVVCVLATAVVGGDPAYLEWVASETRPIGTDLGGTEA